MIREIVTDDEVLGVPCAPATAQDAQLATDLVETLLASEEAACLAANQVGETKAVIAYLTEANRPVVMFNPRITQKLKPFATVETCMSQEDPAAVTRYQWVRVSYDVLVDGKLEPRKKKLEGWTAQIVQHMIDHCNGVLV